MIYLITGVVAGFGCTRTEGASQPARGDALFAAPCARCHGADGRGGVPSAEGPSPRNFRDQAIQTSRTDADLKRTIQQGKGAAMPSFGAFVDAQLTALVAHLRTFDPGPSAVVTGVATPAPGKGNEGR